MRRLLIGIALFVQLVACGGGGSSTPNIGPTANAGADQSVDEQTLVTLTGTGTDSDGNVVSYSWSQTAGTSVTLSNANSATTSFTAPALTATASLTFRLTITDDDGASSSDSMVVTVNPVNAIPTADAGPDQSVIEQALVTLVGSGSDTDGSIVAYSWTQSSGVAVTLSDSQAASPTFTAPSISTEQQLTFDLMVTDNEGATATDQVVITVLVDTPPVADAGASQYVIANAAVTLDATASTDVEDPNNLTFSWAQTDNSGFNVTLTNANTSQATFSAPNITAATTLAFEVTVTDPLGGSDVASVGIVVHPFFLTFMNDTGITTCGNYASAGNWTVNEDCILTSDANGFPIPLGQDGHYGRDATNNDSVDGNAGFSFTKLDANGDPLPADAASWSCVRDNVTRLIWEVKTTSGLHDINNTYSWYNSNPNENNTRAGTQNGGVCTGSDCDTEAFVTAVNAQGLCGANDWMMPNINQISSIVDYSIRGVNIDINYFPNTSSSTNFWTATPEALTLTKAWAINSSSGSIATIIKDTPSRVRLVRMAP